jgi:hypothetical protein
MKYEQPYGVSDPNAPYINGDPSIGRPGSIPPAAAIEYPQREIIAMINAGGFTPSDADLQQLARAIQSGKVIYGLDTGAGNNYSVTLNPPLLAYSDGLALWIVPQLSNTGPATLNCNALGARNIVRRGGDPLAAGDMPGGYKSLVTFNALHNNFELYGSSFTGAGGTGFIPILTANTNLYVNAATGDDTLYDGTAPTISGPHGPFKTIMRAINETFKYGPSVFTMTINVAAGTYNEKRHHPAGHRPDDDHPRRRHVVDDRQQHDGLLLCRERAEQHYRAESARQRREQPGRLLAGTLGRVSRRNDPCEKLPVRQHQFCAWLVLLCLQRVCVLRYRQPHRRGCELWLGVCRQL